MGTILIPKQFNILRIVSAQTGYFLSFISVVAVCAAVLAVAMSFLLMLIIKSGYKIT